MTGTMFDKPPDTVPEEIVDKAFNAYWKWNDSPGDKRIFKEAFSDILNEVVATAPRRMKVAKKQALRAWDKIQEDGENLDFESFWEILKEVFEA
jgi:hypothetical protein